MIKINLEVSYGKEQLRNQKKKSISLPQIPAIIRDRVFVSTISVILGNLRTIHQSIL